MSPVTVTGNDGGGLPEKSPATRRRLPGGGLMAAGYGGSGEATVSPEAHAFHARAFHARAKGGLLEAREGSSGLRSRRGWCLRFRLDGRNTMMALDARD